MNRSYDRLSIESFGRVLITSGDLDPIYIALRRLLRGGVWDRNMVDRWMIAYWCFYHAGVASHMCEYTNDAFWEQMMLAAVNDTESPAGGRWPRGGERRHFRAANAVKAIEYMRKRWPVPSMMVGYLSAGSTPAQPLTLKEVSRRTQEHVGFGPWIGFKVADMLERILDCPVDFTLAEVFMFKDPEKAALKLFEMREGHKYPEGAKLKREVILKNVTEYLQATFADLKAPPGGDRPINIQEVETVLCKWKSHMNGHYPLLNDITEINEGLKAWPNGAARLFRANMPEEET